MAERTMRGGDGMTTWMMNNAKWRAERNNGITVLSLFDGMSGARVALKESRYSRKNILLFGD